MTVEYTGRNCDITPTIKKQVETGLAKLTKILGDNFEAKVILAMEKKRCKAEIALTSRNRQPIVGISEAPDMTSAIDGALDRVEKQAIKNKGRWRNLKRQPKKEKVFAQDVRQDQVVMAVGASANTAVPIAVHNFPASVHTTEAHLTRSKDAVALRPMRLEEAVKECEFRDREVFVFRDMNGDVKVLHRKKDGKLELIEVP
ncbi:MAG TPA: ribosome-associated translation inhibitor RaiA [Terriglobales bacterium]|nr:ribosome-associated translation inhibitor RaiA [Terriglobales bacterium]